MDTNNTKERKEVEKSMIDKAIDLIDRAGGWLLWQVDNNDFFGGVLFGLALFEIPYILGIIDIVAKP